MGVIPDSLVRCSAALLILSASAFALPKLRLSQTTVGPVSVAVAANGPAQTIEAWNIGDGSLNLQVSSTATWLGLTTGAPRNCTTRQGTCIPINIALQTSALVTGKYTGVVKVSDPNAVDAPQTITVIVAIGGGVPDHIDLYMPPNGSAETSFTTNTNVGSSIPATTTAGGKWLNVSLEGTGSFRFVLPYKVRATYQDGMTETTYSGSFQVANSAQTADNKTVPVRVQVTSKPIAQFPATELTYRIAQGAAKQFQRLVVSNRGMGTLTVAGVEPSASSWLKVEPVTGTTAWDIYVDVAGMSPGFFNGSVIVNSNAVNSPVTIPVKLEVLAPDAPHGYTGGAISNLSAVPDVAPGSIASIYGEQFSYKEPATFTKAPIDTTLDGVRVYVNDVAAPVYYGSYGQINFQVPFEAQQGTALVRVEREGRAGNSVSMNINAREPRILPHIGRYGAITFADGVTLPLPSSYGPQYHPAKAGDGIVIYAIGLGATAPAVATGAVAPTAELAWATGTTKVSLGVGLSYATVDTLYAGLSPGYVGLYQVNFIVPENAPKGDEVNVTIQMPGGVQSPAAAMAIQ